MLVSSRGQALFLSTPNGANWFRDLRDLGNDPLNQDWESFHFTTADNPLIPDEELHDIQRVTAEHVWKTEYEAQFDTGHGAVFRKIHQAVNPPLCPDPQPDHAYVAGIDWGRNNDYTAIAVLDAADGQMVALERFNQTGWDLQRSRLKAIVDRWRPLTVWAEANSIGEPNIDALLREGLPIRPFLTTAKSKPPLIEAFALAIERGQVRLLNDPVLLAELKNYQLERLPGGSWRYGAPPGGHDDTVIAAALAWRATQYAGLPLVFA